MSFVAFRRGRNAAKCVFAFALLLPFVLAGCSRIMRSHDLAPNGLTRSEDQWRVMLAQGRGDSVGTRIVRGGSEVPGDELLRLLYVGTAAHYSGEYVRSNQYLEAAAALSDDRITKSLSRSLFSLISNDGVLPYAPAPSERLLIPYYAALNYIALDQMEDAAVEARRLAALLQPNASEQTKDLSGDVRSLRATLRSFTGAVFEATGNRNDALVAYRNAAALGAVVDTSALTGPHGDSTGTVVVLLEDGFVAHRVEQSLFVWLGPDEMYAFSNGGPQEGRAEAASSVASRVMTNALGGDRPWRGRGRGDFYIPLPDDLRHSRRQNVCEADGDRRRADNDRDDDSDRTERDRGRGAGTNAAPGTGGGTGSISGRVNRAVGEGAPSISDALKKPVPRPQPTDTASNTDTKPTVDTKPSSETKPASDAKPANNSPRRDTHASQPSCRNEDDVPYLLKVAWPVYSDVQVPRQAFVTAGGDTVSASFVDLSGAVLQDYSSQAPMIVARTIARGAAKAALTQSAKRKASEKNETVGKIIGMLGNVGNVMLERADTRSWHLLPAGVAVVRMRVPAGAQRMSVTLPGRAPVDLGMVNVDARKISFVTKRAF